jgi:type IV fimbrial biogenesis protein FimT
MSAMARMATRRHGFSLVELMVALTVMAILLAIAVPSFRDVLRRHQVSSASNALLAELSYARTEAINRGQLVSMCPSPDGSSCTAAGKAFDLGWLVYTYPAVAASANEPYAAGSSILLRATDARAGVSIQSSGTTVITFGQQGQLRPSVPTLVFVTCFRNGSSGTGSNSTAVAGVELDVNGSGSVMTQSLAAGAGCTPP